MGEGMKGYQSRGESQVRKAGGSITAKTHRFGCESGAGDETDATKVGLGEKINEKVRRKGAS